MIMQTYKAEKEKSRIGNKPACRRRTFAAVFLAAVLLALAAAGLFSNLMNGAQREKSERMLAFATAYANYFTGRDGNGLVGLYIDEETAYDNVIMLDETDGAYTFGYSSPWPDEFRLTVDEEAQKVKIRYFACSSHPQVTVWKEEMSFVDTKDGYRVTESRLKVFDGISSREEFLDAYLIFDEYQFVDYEERGFVDAINEQTRYDRETGAETDSNAVYRNPETAAEWILHLTGGKSVVSRNSSGQAVVTYAFADGSSIDFPMYNVNYTGETDHTEKENADTGVINTEDVWIVDVRVWNAKAP